MNIYDLSKDELVYLISTIQEQYKIENMTNEQLRALQKSIKTQIIKNDTIRLKKRFLEMSLDKDIISSIIAIREEEGYLKLKFKDATFTIHSCSNFIKVGYLPSYSKKLFIAKKDIPDYVYPVLTDRLYFAFEILDKYFE